MAGCSSDDNSKNAFYLDNQIYINYINNNGQNLLDSSTTGAYEIEDMKLFYLVDNKPIDALIIDKYNSGGISATSNNTLKIFTNVSVSNVIEETKDYKIVENIAYLQLSDSETDTIKTHSETGYNYYKTSKVWYNSQLVWDIETGGVIEIVKNLR